MRPLDRMKDQCQKGPNERYCFTARAPMMWVCGRASLPGRDGQGRLDPRPRRARRGPRAVRTAILVASALALWACSDSDPAPADTADTAESAETAAPAPPSPTSQAPSPPPDRGDGALESDTEPPAASTPPPDASEFGQPELIGAFDPEVVPGASGLATSEANPGARYLLDDRPGTGEVWVLREDGSLRGSIEVEGLDALDTESLSVAPCDGDSDTSCVYVGDVGDNLRSRENVRVYRFPEPDLTEGLPGRPVDADVATLTYPGEPEDVEAMLVDSEGVPHLVSKAPFDAERGTTGVTRLYTPGQFADGELREVGPLDLPPPQQPLLSLIVGDVVTGGSVGPDGRVLLRTYDHVLLGTPPRSGAPLESLADWDFEEVPTPMLPQAEAITWAADGCGYDLVSELIGDVWHVPCVTG